MTLAPGSTPSFPVEIMGGYPSDLIRVKMHSRAFIEVGQDSPVHGALPASILLDRKQAKVLVVVLQEAIRRMEGGQA